MDSSLTYDELASILLAAKLPPSAMHNIMEQIHTQDNALERSGISQHVRALTATSYQGAWFYYAGATKIAFPMLGSIPGQQLGD
eukprot:5188851-Pyramimonas_sp.AAC.1